MRVERTVLASQAALKDTTAGIPMFIEDVVATLVAPESHIETKKDGKQITGLVTRSRQQGTRRETTLHRIRRAFPLGNGKWDNVMPASEEGDPGHVGRQKLYRTGGKICRKGCQKSRGSCIREREDQHRNYFEVAYYTSAWSTLSCYRSLT